MFSLENIVGFFNYFLRSFLATVSGNAVPFNCETNKVFKEFDFIKKPIFDANLNFPEGFKVSVQKLSDKRIEVNKELVIFSNKELYFDDFTGTLITKPGRSVFNDSSISVGFEVVSSKGSGETPNDLMKDLAISMKNCYKIFLSGEKDPLLYIDVEKPFTCEEYFIKTNTNFSLSFNDLNDYLVTKIFKEKPFINQIGGSFRVCNTIFLRDNNDVCEISYGSEVKNVLKSLTGDEKDFFYKRASPNVICLPNSLNSLSGEIIYETFEPREAEINYLKACIDIFDGNNFLRKDGTTFKLDLSKLDLEKFFSESFTKNVKIGFFDDTTKNPDFDFFFNSRVNNLRTWESCSSKNLILKSLNKEDCDNDFFSESCFINQISSLKARVIPKKDLTNQGEANNFIPLDSVILC